MLGVILGDARGHAVVNAQVGTGSGWSGETALIRLKGEVVKHPESVVLPLLLPDSPVAVWWPADAPEDPAGDPLGALGPAADHRCRIGHAGQDEGDAPPVHGVRARATPTSRGPGSPRGGRCSPPPWTSTRPRSRSASVTAERISPSADLLVAWLSDRLKVDVDAAQLRRARASPRWCSGRSRVTSASTAATASWRSSPRPASPIGRSRSSVATSPSCCRGAPAARRGRHVRRDRTPPGQAGELMTEVSVVCRRATLSRARWPSSCSTGCRSIQAAGRVPSIALTGGTIAVKIYRALAQLDSRGRGLDAGGLLVGRRALRGGRLQRPQRPRRRAGPARRGRRGPGAGARDAGGR